MNWTSLETAFQKAFRGSFSYRQCLTAFVALVSSGSLTVLCWALSYKAPAWISLSLFFVPIFASFAILLIAGMILCKMYLQEDRRSDFSFEQILFWAKEIFISIASLVRSFLFIYLIVWSAMGVFFLLKALPWIGEFLSIFLSIGPFLFIFASFLLCFASVVFVFFVAPMATLDTIRSGTLLHKVWQIWQGHILSALLLLFLSAIPFLFTTILLYFSAMLTNTSFFSSESSLSIAMQRFLLMIPFVAILTPSLVFFFHFAVESLRLKR
jgi:hypothetical protein